MTIYTENEAAAILKINPQTLRNYRSLGKIGYFQPDGKGARVHYSPEHLRAYLRKIEKKPDVVNVVSSHESNSDILFRIVEKVKSNSFIKIIIYLVQGKRKLDIVKLTGNRLQTVYNASSFLKQNPALREDFKRLLKLG